MFSALERLRRLRAGLPITPPEAITITTWTDLPADWLVDFEERAAIREFEGGQAREHAEAEALGEIITAMSSQGITVIRQ